MNSRPAERKDLCLRVEPPVGLAFNNAGILFETDFLGGNVNEFTPGGAQSNFSSGWTYAQALAFDNTGNLFLFEGSYLNTDIIEFMSGGGKAPLPQGSRFPPRMDWPFKESPCPCRNLRPWAC